MNTQNSAGSGGSGGAPTYTNPIAVHPHAQFIIDTVTEEVKRQMGGNGGGGDMTDTERRVGNLESDVKAIKQSVNALCVDVAVIKSNYATQSYLADIKADLATVKSNYATQSDIANVRAEIAKETLTLTRWIVASAIAVSAVTIAAQRLFPPQQTTPAAAIEHHDTQAEKK